LFSKPTILSNNKRFNIRLSFSMLLPLNIYKSVLKKIIFALMALLFISCKLGPSHLQSVITIKLSAIQLISIVIIVVLVITIIIMFQTRRYLKLKQQQHITMHESDILRALIDNIPDFIYIKDTQSRFVVANKHTVQVLNAESPENIIGKTDFDFFPKKMAQKFFNDEQRIIKTKKPLINIEEEALDQKKRLITIATTKVPWYDRHGNILGIIGIGRNITKFKEIEKKLVEQTKHLQEVNILLEEKHEHINHQTEELTVQAENLRNLNLDLQKINNTKDKFVSIIAHDLKNPFNAIINFSELLTLKADPAITPKQMEMIKIINSSSKMAYSLLENLLYWGKSQSSSIPFNPAELNIGETIEEVIEFLEVSAVLKEITITNHSDPNLKTYADHDMVTTILRNLLSNAIKFTSKTGQITISSEIDDKFGYITISDTGIGISPKQIEELFVVNKEIYKGTSGEVGTGLGLILCKEFALRNGGDIIVKSEVRKGSSFILSLPLRP
jgi:PAS domain S-box-containing protein